MNKKHKCSVNICGFIINQVFPALNGSLVSDFTQQAELVHVKLGFVDTAETFSAVKGLIPVNIRDN